MEVIIVREPPIEMVRELRWRGMVRRAIHTMNPLRADLARMKATSGKRSDRGHSAKVLSKLQSKSNRPPQAHGFPKLLQRHPVDEVHDDTVPSLLVGYNAVDHGNGDAHGSRPFHRKDLILRVDQIGDGFGDQVRG